MRHVTIRDFKKQKNLIFWIVTRVSARNNAVGCKWEMKMSILSAWPSEQKLIIIYDFCVIPWIRNSFIGVTLE